MQDRFAQAQAEFSRALELDDMCVDAWMRRGLARALDPTARVDQSVGDISRAIDNGMRSCASCRAAPARGAVE